MTSRVRWLSAGVVLLIVILGVVISLGFIHFGFGPDSSGIILEMN